MNINIKQLLLTSALCTFSAQAMQEVKREQEIKEKEDRKEAVELRELRRRFPHSINFLIKVLGAQKGKQQALGETLVIKTGLPNDLILKIINNYLRIDKVKLWNADVNSKDMINSVISVDTEFHSRHRFNSAEDIDHMELTLRADQDMGAYNLRIGKYPVQRDNQIYSFATTFPVKFMDHSVLDINPKLNTDLEIIVQRTQDNKYKVIAGFIGVAGLAYYLIKKFRR